ncbi:MAG: hypothetical protein QM736_04780 [Vicinamibacterales bacterium]
MRWRPTLPMAAGVNASAGARSWRILAVDESRRERVAAEIGRELAASSARMMQQ